MRGVLRMEARQRGERRDKRASLSEEVRVEFSQGM